MDELKHKEQEIEKLIVSGKSKDKNLVRLSLVNKELLDEVEKIKKENRTLKKEIMNKHSNDMTSFLGKPISFWIGLSEQITELNLEWVITINATYRFLLTRIEDIVKSRPKNIGFQLEDYWKIQKILNEAKRAERLENGK